ncbi:hypothetical protein CSA56_10775 [candidate division KSB3 bacterium]|uniref:OmpA-like domain-containing protein n=1 Tax=candidate division KSB3 bacterium TaxID=2044937 RepID=A0A2G6KD30_9BACT|nr:MAG: hypothetical protein CSA56_10775 [candidate division KSB3 bacterium]
MKKSYLVKTFIVVVSLMLLGTSLTSFAQERPRTSTQKLIPEEKTRKISPVPRDTVKIDLWLDKPSGSAYKQQEKIIISFRTNTDGYITLYDIDTRGQVSVLFPNRNQPDNYVRGGKIYTVPDRSYSYDLMVEGPEGIEYVDAVVSTDSYYSWNYHQGEPRWVREWGLTGRNYQNLASSSRYKKSSEYRNRPSGFGRTGEQSLANNFTISRKLREDIRAKIVESPRAISEKPREQQRNDYGTATCHFYVMADQTYPPAASYPSYDEYLRQQQEEFRRIPGIDARQADRRLIVTVPGTILFDNDSYALRYEARRDLDQIADILVRYPDTSVTVAGHTDSRGHADYNQRLSEYRAQSVANYLASRGVPPYRISSVGYGETMPIASNATESGRQRNRRVELDIRVNQQYGQ